jgi:peptidoglycan biosynthesis protein MviN/MurJ (putative lipid II flippase)
MTALLSRAYYANGNTKRPLSVNFLCSVLIVISAYVFLHLFENTPFFRYFMESLFKVSDIPGTEVLMLPLAYSFGTILNFILHWISVKHDFMRHEYFVGKTFFQSLGASFFIGGISYLGLNILSPIFGTTTFLGVFLQGFISGVLGVVTGVFVLWLLGSQELKDIVETLKSKFWRAKIVTEAEGGL